jgi:cellulose synthase/poly-beta-1,6-N-acetylglucosamine synthase-like glycosyltransferase
MNLEPIWIIPLVLSFGSLTFLFPLLASIVFKESKRLKPLLPQSVDILIPAYNEAKTIERTLESVTKSIESATSSKVRLVIALDGPKDATPEIVKSFAGQVLPRGISVKILERSLNQGKWFTLMELVGESQGDWSILMDCGTLWSEEFLKQILDRLKVSSAIGLAPGYRESNGSLSKRLIWWQERFLKSIENLAGGPVSLHGATMIFRTQELKRAMKDLKDRPWLNDDVVMSLSLRKQGEIDYLGSSLSVSDCGVENQKSELTRRKRILVGNLEWIRELYFRDIGRLIKTNPAVAILCLRRIARVFWVYHLVAVCFFTGMVLGLGWQRSIAVSALAIALMSMVSTLREAGWISLCAPFMVWRKRVVAPWS